jgi:hypothetical protein
MKKWLIICAVAAVLIVLWTYYGLDSARRVHLWVVTDEIGQSLTNHTNSLSLADSLVLPMLRSELSNLQHSTTHLSEVSVSDDGKSSALVLTNELGEHMQIRLAEEAFYTCRVLEFSFTR